MSAGLVILLLVPAGEPNGPVAARASLVAGVVAAAGRSLGPSARVLVNEESKSSDDAAIALADRLHANAVVTLQWLEHDRVALHAHWSGRSGWTDRFFNFDAADAPDERGRTIGFTLAAMAQEQAPALPATQRAAIPEARPRFRLDLEAAAQVVAGSNVTSLGGLVRAAVSPIPALAFTGSAAWRAGSVGVVDGSLHVLALAGGLRIPIVHRGAFELALQAEGVASHEAVSRTDARGDDQGRSRWIPGAQLSAVGGYWVLPQLALVAALGSQVTFGSTDVVVQGRTAATLSPYRATFELGVRWRF